MLRLPELTESFAETAAYQIAEVYAYRGDKDRAFEWLERARRQRDAGLGFAVRYIPRESPRGPALECVFAQDGPGRRSIEMSAPNGKANA